MDKKNLVHMVDINNKKQTKRIAKAKGKIKLSLSTIALISQGDLPKGNVLTIAKIAGIMAAKRVHELIPLCHPLPLSSITINFIIEPNGILIESIASATASTGVEMEALTSVSIAALTIYDMVKSIEKTATIEKIWLEEKKGGKSDFNLSNDSFNITN